MVNTLATCQWLHCIYASKAGLRLDLLCQRGYGFELCSLSLHVWLRLWLILPNVTWMKSDMTSIQQYTMICHDIEIFCGLTLSFDTGRVCICWECMLCVLVGRGTVSLSRAAETESPSSHGCGARWVTAAVADVLHWHRRTETICQLDQWSVVVI